MANIESDPHAWLEERMKRWDRDHVRGEIQLVIRPRQTEGPVSLFEFGDTRLEVRHAVEELERVLFTFLRESLERVVTEVSECGMPPQEACARYAFRAKQVLKNCVDRFKERLVELILSKKDHWDEYERRFSQDEIEGIGNKFQSMAEREREENSSAFTSAVWTGASPQLAVVAETSGGNKNKAGARIAFVQPRLADKGWNALRWASEARLDKNSVGNYLKGKTKKLRPDTLKKLADALGVSVSEMPQ
jgi:DNA-binding Xre family transcriptional regulator